MTGFGKPKYTSTSNYAKTIKLKDGSNIVRIIPPMKSLADAGVWYVFEKRHFGYYTANGKEADKPLPSPFRCIEESNRDGLITKACPECDRIRRNAETLEARVFETKNMPPEQVEPLLKPLKAFQKDHNLDKKYWVNVKTDSGEFGMCPIPTGAFKKLREKMDKVRSDEGVDPIAADEGCYFNITRKGQGLKTEYDVEVVYVYSTLPDGRKVQELKKAPLSQEDFDAAMRDCGDLKHDCVRVITFDQIKALAESSGDPDEVAAIMNVAHRRESSSERSPAPVAPKAPATPAPTPKPDPKPVDVKPVEVKPEETKPVEVKADDEEAEMLRKLEEIRKKKAAAAAAAEAKPVETKPAASFGKAPTTSMSDEDFMKMFPDPTNSN